MLKQMISDLIPNCCDIGFLNISDCSSLEQSLVKEFFEETNTVIVLAHNVKSSLEWMWYPHEAERNNNTCGADLHVKNIIEKIEYGLKEKGYISYIVPYPGKSGLRMKDFANKTAMGQIGENYLFLHRNWGPWVHLRLLLTNAQIEDSSATDIDVCIHCGKCISACPAKALKDGSFNGIACDQYQMSQCIDLQDNYRWKCEVCARVCPIGKSPMPLKIERDEI